MSNKVSVFRLHEMLSLDHKTGQLYWKSSMREAGGVERVGEGRYYRRLCIDGVRIYSHRVVFAMVHGYWPKEVDHANGDALDCRPDNLIDAGQAANMRNRAANSNESPYGRGVSLMRREGGAMFYRSKVRFDGVSYVRDISVNKDKALLKAQLESLKLYQQFGFSDRHMESLIQAIERNPDYQSWDVRAEQIA